MKYFIDGKQATEKQVRQYLLKEYEKAKDSRYFQGRIFYNFEYLRDYAKRYMNKTKEKDWAYFSLRFEA